MTETENYKKKNIYFQWVKKIPLSNLPIYFENNYLNIFAEFEKSKLRILKCSFNSILYLPLLIKDMGSFKEAYSAYGYGGFLGEGKITSKNLEALKIFLSSEGIISLFIRYSPFLENHKIIDRYNKELNRHTYSIELKKNKSFETFKKTLRQKIRWSVNYALRANLSVNIKQLQDCSYQIMEEFYDLYSNLMQSKSIKNETCFNKEFFNDHLDKLKKNCYIFYINDSNTHKMIAGSLFLTDNSQWSHYHLSATSMIAMKNQSMELILSMAIFFFGNKNFKYLHLGGGHNLDEKDGLSYFKRKFSSTKHDFYCSKIICNDNQYFYERKMNNILNNKFFLISHSIKD